MTQREIKFRAWNPTTKRMSTSAITLNNAYCFLPACEMMQFTGLKDEKGIEIYEGDILHIVERGDYGGEYNAPVSYLENWALFGLILVRIKEIAKSKSNARVDTIFTRGFLTRKFGSCVSLGEAIEFDVCEVIGNVCENPELLETKSTSDEPANVATISETPQAPEVNNIS